MEFAVAIMIGLPLLYVAIDIGLALNRKTGDTYSEIIRAAARRFLPLALMIAFGFGLLCGHWFW